MISYYADVLPDGRVRGCFPHVSPPVEGWAPQIEGELATLDGPISWAGPTDTSVLYMVDGVLEWRETQSLSDQIARVVDQIDDAGETARQSVMIKRPMKADEYAQAEQQSAAWRAAGYVGDAPDDVSCWARAKWRDGMTPQEAADDILLKATQYRALLSAIRALRLIHMENARHAANAVELGAIVAEFTTSLGKLMAGAQ